MVYKPGARFEYESDPDSISTRFKGLFPLFGRSVSGKIKAPLVRIYSSKASATVRTVSNLPPEGSQTEVQRTMVLLSAQTTRLEG